MTKLDLKFKKKPVFRFDDENELRIVVRKEAQQSRRSMRRSKKAIDDESYTH